MTTAAAGAPSLELPAEPEFRDSHQRDSRAARVRWGAIVAALLIHALVILFVVGHWPRLFAPPPLPPVIPVTLVMQPPAAPKVETPPLPTPPSPQQERMSGPDQVTTAPPVPAEKGPDAAPPAEPTPPPPQLTAPNEVAAVPEPKPKPPEPRPQRPKPAQRVTAPDLPRGAVNRAPGENFRAGDPYLNQLWSMIEAHRTYPANAVGPLGLPLEGTAVLLMGIRSDGRLQGVKLERSAGAEVLDRTALKMIEDAAPFPPPPPSYPPPGVVLEVTIHLFPGAS